MSTDGAIESIEPPDFVVTCGSTLTRFQALGGTGTDETGKRFLEGTGDKLVDGPESRPRTCHLVRTVEDVRRGSVSTHLDLGPVVDTPAPLRPQNPARPAS